MAYVPRHERHVPRQERYVPRHDGYVPRQERHVPRQERYVPRQERYVAPQKRYVPRQERDVPRQERYVAPQESYVPRQGRYVAPQESYVPRQERYVAPQESYVPRHERHRTETQGRTLARDLPVTEFKSNHDPSPLKKSYNVEYANNAIRRWIPIGLDKDEQIPSSFQLRPFSAEFIQRSLRVKTLGLVNTTLDSAEVSEAHSEHWVSIAENVLQDLVSSFEVVRNEMKGQNSELVKPVVLVKLGKILFYDRDPSKTAKAMSCSPTKASLNYMKRCFYGHVVESHMDHIKRAVILNIGVEFLQEKNTYHVMLCDASRPGSVIACRCGVAEGASNLVLYKLQSNRLRHMIIDISCLDKNLDLRLMLFSKRYITILSKEEMKSITDDDRPEVPDDAGRSGFLTEEEMTSITDLVTSAVPDGNVKGGIGWPFGMVSSGDRFRVVNAWHTVSKIYESSSIRLKWRHADRIDYRTSIGDVASEVSVKLKGVASALLEQKLDMDSISNMLKGELKLIWEHFLSN